MEVWEGAIIFGVVFGAGVAASISNSLIRLASATEKIARRKP